MGVVDLRRPGDRLAIRHLRLPDIGRNSELPAQPRDDGIEVELSRPRKDGASRLLVSPRAEGRILRREAPQRARELIRTYPAGKN